MKRTFQPSKLVRKKDMVLDLGCRQMVVKKSSITEDKKEEKFCQPKKANKLKKRSDFLKLRSICKKIHGNFVILNFSKSKGETKYGITVSKENWKCR